MKNIFIGVSLFLLMLISGIGKAQVTNTQAYSVFTYNFLKYTKWSGEMGIGNIKVTFLGNSKVFEEFTKVAKNKMIAGRKITVTKIKKLDEVTPCNLLYVSENSTSLVDEVVIKIAATGTLVITERPKMIKKGAGISFLVDGDRLRFQINDAILAQNNIKLASSLKNLAYKE